MARSASVICRHLRLSVLPLALVSLTACGTMDAAPTATDLAPTKQGGKGKPVNVLKDGGFEPGSAAWTADPSSVLCDAACPVGEPHKGLGWAQFGASEGATETLSQTVTIPQGRARLEFRLHDEALGNALLEALVDGQVMFSYTAVSNPAVGEDDHDEDEDGDEDEDEESYTLSAASFDDDEDEGDEDFTEGYEKVKFDVSTFADGGPHTVTFRVSVGAGGVAGLSVDDAALEVKLLRNLVPEISQDVSALKLHKSVSRPLVTKLDKAATALARNRAKDAIKELKAFAKEVRGHRGKKIKAPAADDLIEEAQEVIEVID